MAPHTCRSASSRSAGRLRSISWSGALVGGYKAQLAGGGGGGEGGVGALPL
jgi:hypothetical protein